MDRRGFLKQSAALSVVAGVTSIGGIKRAEAKVMQSQEQISPLTVPAGGMLPAAFLIGNSAVPLDICGPLEVFTDAATKDGTQLFAPYMVAATKSPVTVGGGMTIVPDHDFKTAPQPKVIVIPAMDDAAVTADMLAWIRTASKQADVTMSVCNGAFILAKTGLLDGKSAAAHHSGYITFAAEYPKIHLKRGARFVEEGNVASSGGISSGIDLALRVVQRYTGLEMTEQVIDGMEYQGKGWQKADSNRAYATMAKQIGDHPLCAACFTMYANSTIASTHKGKNYTFCSVGCKQMFDGHTDIVDRFLAEDAAYKG